MDGWLEIGLILLLTLLGILAWAANVLGLPGNWAMVIMSGLSLWLIPETSRSHLGVAVLVAIIVIAVIGEILEFAASAMGASRLGGSKRGAALAIVGSMVGAIAGLFFGTAIPIPIVGNLIGSVVLGAIGAFGGAVAGERWAGKEWDDSFQIGGAAFWGRILGTVGKAACGTIACICFLSAIWF